MTTIRIHDITSNDRNDVPATTRASRALTGREINGLNSAYGRDEEPDMRIGTVADLHAGETAWVYDEGQDAWWVSTVERTAADILDDHGIVDDDGATICRGGEWYCQGCDDAPAEEDDSHTDRAAIVTEELAQLALSTLEIEESSEDSSHALSEAIPYPLAQRLCAALEERGVEASWARDHDDHDLAWVYVTL